MKCVIYGRGNCSFCKRAVELAKQLQGHGYGEYQYIDIVAAGIDKQKLSEMVGGFAPIFPDTFYHLTHYWPAAADIPVASDNPAHYADAIRYNARTPLQGSLLPLTRLVWA